MAGLASPLDTCRVSELEEVLCMSGAIHSSTDNFLSYSNLSVSGYEHPAVPQIRWCSSKASHYNSCVGRQTRLSCRQHSALPLHPCTKGDLKLSRLDWWFSAEHNKGPESHNVEQLVTYSPVLTPSCGAWKPWKVTQSVCMFMISCTSVCLSAQRKIIMCLNLTIPCIPKDILPALLNKELYCTLIPMEKGNNHSCEYDYQLSQTATRGKQIIPGKSVKLALFSCYYCVSESNILLRKRRNF